MQVKLIVFDCISRKAFKLSGNRIELHKLRIAFVRMNGHLFPGKNKEAQKLSRTRAVGKTHMTVVFDKPRLLRESAGRGINDSVG